MIEEEGRLGTPIMGWGSYPNVWEAARIGKLLVDEGSYRSQQLLNRIKFGRPCIEPPREGWEQEVLMAIFRDTSTPYG